MDPYKIDDFNLSIIQRCICSNKLRQIYFSNPWYFIPTKKNRKLRSLIKKIERPLVDELSRFYDGSPLIDSNDLIKSIVKSMFKS